MWGRIRYRRLQAVALLLLAALVTVCACLGPLYQRAMEQGLTRTTLHDASSLQKAVAVTSYAPLARIARTLPSSIRRDTEAPVLASTVTTVAHTPSNDDAASRIYGLEGACQHVRIADGRCPTAPGEVMVSTDEVAAFGWTVGTSVHVSELERPGAGGVPPTAELRIVGIYQSPAGATWVGQPITGRAGTLVDPQSTLLNGDDWVTVPGTLDGSTAVADWFEVTHAVTWALDEDAVNVDELLRIGPLVGDYLVDVGGLTQGHPFAAGLSGDSQLPTLAQDVERGRHQGRVTVVALMLQLLVLALVVFWLVLGAACDQRRPEIALARLRGRGSAGAARYLLAELVPIALAGVLLGGVVTLALMVPVGRAVFPLSVPLEAPGSFWLAWGGAAIGAVLVVWASVRRVVREPVSSLLRAVPPRVAGRLAGAAEVVVVAVCVTAVAAFVTGNLEGPLAVVAPTLLALAVALVLGRLLVPLAARSGELLLRRGHAVGAVGLLQIARRPVTRRVLVLVVVSTALLVFAADALATGDHNRQLAAEQANGAPLTLLADINDPGTVDAVVDVVHSLDPEGRDLTPVVSVSSPGDQVSPTVAVDPTSFPRVALFPGGAPDAALWKAVRAPEVAPLRITGSRLRGLVDFDGVSLSGQAEPVADLRLRVNTDGDIGLARTVELARLRGGSSTAHVNTYVPCQEGCEVTGLGFDSRPALSIKGTFTVRSLRVDGGPDVPIGPASRWQKVTDSDRGLIDPTAGSTDALTATFVSHGEQLPVMSHAWVPLRVPALVTGGPDQLAAPGLDAENQDMTAVGRIARVPGSPPEARVVDLDSLLRQGALPTTNGSVAIWFRTDDPGLLARVRAALAKHGVGTLDTSRLGQVRAGLDASPPAWSLQLAGLVGGASLLVALLVLLVVTSTSWRPRAADLASLRMSGVSDRAVRRIGTLEQVPVIVAGVLLGLACGVVGGHYALPSVRQFTEDPAVPTTDFSVPWTVVLVVAVGAAVLLGVLAWVSGRWTVRRARLTSVREVL